MKHFCDVPALERRYINKEEIKKEEFIEVICLHRDIYLVWWGVSLSKSESKVSFLLEQLGHKVFKMTSIFHHKMANSELTKKPCLLFKEQEGPGGCHTLKILHKDKSQRGSKHLVTKLPPLLCMCKTSRHFHNAG